MSNIDKVQFGQFISELRKEKGFTQKELAERLLVSSKAISKWETGANMPDVSLLIPLADILSVTVTELLQCERVKKGSIEPKEVEQLVKKAISMKESETQTSRTNRKKRIVMFAGCLIISLVETGALIVIPSSSNLLASALPYLIIGYVLGVYFTFFMRDQLPTFYDENRINFYTDGIMKINMPGLYFNNSNWPHISAYLRLWANAHMITVPLFFFLSRSVIPTQISGFTFLFLLIGTLFIPLYVIGKKYE